MTSLPSVRRVPYSSLRFNAKAQRYISPLTGRFINPTAIRGTIDDDIDVAAQRMQRAAEQVKPLAAKFKAGEIGQAEYLAGVEQWRDSFASEIKALHLGNLAAGKGGFHQMSQSDFGRAGALIREQYKALNGFAVEVGENPDIVTGEAAGKMDFMQRVGMYAEAGRGTYALTRDRECRAHFKSKRNVPDPAAKHCVGPDSCTEMTEKGLVAVDDPTYIVEGFRLCRNKCGCETEFLMEEAV